MWCVNFIDVALLYTWLFKIISFLLKLFHYASEASIFAEYIPKFQRYIYAQLVRTTEYVKNFHEMPKTLDYMDALNKNYSRRTASSKGIRKFLVKEEAKRLVAYENLIFDYF